jgi:ppGpp synthetase/RelA/SpoT-type nucleotidyltranferase
MNKDQFLKKYKKQRPLYSSFATLIKDILKLLLKESGTKYQKLDPRAKTVKSLSRNLDSPNRYGDLNQIYDLAGCRVIFYLESDKDLFAGKIYDEFEILNEQLKYSEDSYNAKHIIIKLKKQTRGVKYFSKYKHLKCEVQLTTVLDHVWSEIEHDIVYKPPQYLLKLFPNDFDQIKKQFFDVMKNHIKPANQTFEFILKRFKSTESAAQIFNVDFLSNLINSKSNNHIFESFILLNEAINEFGDQTPPATSIPKLVRAALNNSFSNKIKPIKTPYGNYDGRTYEDVALECLKTIDKLRYLHTHAFFPILINLSRDGNNAIRDKALEIIKHLAQYNPEVLKKADLHFQFYLLEKIERWPDKRLKLEINSLIAIAGELLHPSAEGTSMKDHKTFLISFPPLNPNKDIKNLRSRTIKLLERVFPLLDKGNKNLEVLDTLQNAAQTPRTGSNYKFNQMVQSNLRTILRFFIKVIQASNFQVIHKIEDNMHWLLLNHKNTAFPDLKKFKSILNSNKDYQIFKIMVGHDFSFSKDIGKTTENDYDQIEKYRREKIDKYINTISKKSFEEKWKTIIFKIAEAYRTDADKSSYSLLFYFLRNLAKRQPALVEKLFNGYDIEPFLLELLLGVSESSLSSLYNEIALDWLKNEKHLNIIAGSFEFMEKIDINLIESTYKKAKKNKDKIALKFLTIAIFKNHNKSKKLKDLFLNCIRELSKLEDTSWANYLYFHKDKSILKQLNSQEINIILKNLTYRHHIDHQVELMLIPITDAYPELIIKFFLARISIQNKKKDLFGYDAIPFRFNKLNNSLKVKWKLIFKQIFSWFLKRDSIYHREGARLLKIILPSFENALKKELSLLIQTKIPKNIQIVFLILNEYKGEVFLHSICKEILKQFPESKAYRRKIITVLSKTGVVSGEYGFVNSITGKIKEIKGWRKSPNKAVQSFAIEYEDYLNQRIPYERKRADDDIDAMKREFSWFNE